MIRFSLFPLLLAGLLSATLVGCGSGQQPLRIGGKQSPENQIVAEMVAEMAEVADIPVTRRIGLGSTRLTLAALKRGEIDLYPEYTGTGLAMLGIVATGDDAEVLRLLRERFAPLGLGWSDGLGFDNSYGLVMLPDRAEALGIDTYSDLARRSPQLRLGVDTEFAARPLDGLQPLQRRYRMAFQDILEVPVADRLGLYDQLYDGHIDVALVHDVDGQLDIFDLRLLEDDFGFFPAYEAALVYREAALARFPALRDVLDQLAGILSDERMRALSGRVSLRGEDPREVARSELARLGLIAGVGAETPRQALNLAVSLSANADGEAGQVLRALRRSFPARDVKLMRSPDPLDAVKTGNARLALVSAPIFFAPGAADPDTGQPSRRSGVEAVALVGTSYLQAFALEPGISRLEQAAFIATGPEGSSSHRAAESLIDGLDLSATLLPAEGDTPQSLADALIESGADAAVLMQPIGNSTALELLERGLPLLPVDDWTRGNNRIVFPYLQPAQLARAQYGPYLSRTSAGEAAPDALDKPVETLATQLVLAGPAPVGEPGLGSQGPGASFIPNALPLTDLSVQRINDAIGLREEIVPILPQARALAPRLPQPPEPLNPSPGASLLSVLVMLMLIWMAWLLMRPGQRR